MYVLIREVPPWQWNFPSFPDERGRAIIIADKMRHFSFISIFFITFFFFFFCLNSPFLFYLSFWWMNMTNSFRLERDNVIDFRLGLIFFCRQLKTNRNETKKRTNGGTSIGTSNHDWNSYCRKNSSNSRKMLKPSIRGGIRKVAPPAAADRTDAKPTPYEISSTLFNKSINNKSRWINKFRQFRHIWIVRNYWST